MIAAQSNSKQTDKTNLVSTDVQSNWDEIVQNFEDLNLKNELLRGVYGYGFTKPSIIQQKGILPLLKGKDTLAQAQSGTGKTGAFAISLLQLIDESSPRCQALVLCPTRELAQQTQKVLLCLGEFLKIAVMCMIGGTHPFDDIKKLKDGVHVVVGTPGRVFDMMNKQHLRAEHLKLLIIDEADEMLGRGFKDQVGDIFKLLPGDVQVGLFSATLSPEIIDITKSFMRDPARILVKNEELTLDGIKQFYLGLKDDSYKFPTLVELYSHLDVIQSIIYCNTKKRVDELTQQMKEKKFYCVVNA
jgi:translation initiation factor 4A